MWSISTKLMFGMSAIDASQDIEVASLEEAHEAMRRMGWTDGLLAVPPTDRLVSDVLDYLGRDPQEYGGVPESRQLDMRNSS